MSPVWGLILSGKHNFEKGTFWEGNILDKIDVMKMDKGKSKGQFADDSPYLVKPGPIFINLNLKSRERRGSWIWPTFCNICDFVTKENIISAKWWKIFSFQFL